MELKKRLGKRIQELRLKNNLKQSELAEKVGIATKHQSCIENGRNFPSSDLLDKYAVVFNMDICELLKLEHQQPRIFLEEKLHNIIANSSDEEFKTIYKLVTSLYE